jgi:two-component system sensor histidine kinase TctE
VRNGHIELDLPPQAVAVLRTDRYDQIYYRVADPSGAFLAGDVELPSMPSAPDQSPYFLDAHYLDHPVRMVVYRAPTALGEVTIQVAETTTKREQLTKRIVAALLMPNVVLISATLLLVYFGVRFGLAPLARVRAEIEARSPRDLSPLQYAAVPAEVQPLVRSLNRLLSLVRESSEAQQRFLADAAHQLRTPLAGLQTQIELIPLEGVSEDARARLRLLQDATRRLAHLASQLLALARADPSANLAQEMQPLDLRDIVEDAASRYLDQALAKDMDIGFEATYASIAGSKWLLREMADNLIENALAYTPPAGRVTVRCGTAGNGAFLEVEDNGPGIPESERSQVFTRFYRMPGSPGDGCGLGLAIVKEIAELHGARVEIQTPDRAPGTRVRILFPRSLHSVEPRAPATSADPRPAANIRTGDSLYVE